MFGKLFGQNDKDKPGPALPVVRNVTIGRTVVLDPFAWRRFGEAARFALDRDTLAITAQGMVELDEGSFIHRFYTDDHLMLQAVSDDREGLTANDFTLFVPFESDYPSSDATRRAWAERLRRREFETQSLPPFKRLWFGDEEADQAPVSFWETVWDDRAATKPYARLFQTCMLFHRDLPAEGRELLLAITLEPERGDTTHEIMIGVPLQMGEFRA